MRKSVLSAVIMVAMVAWLIPAGAQETVQEQPSGGHLPLNFSLGVSYRNFHSISFKGATLPAFQGVFSALEGPEGIGSFDDKVNNYVWPEGGPLAMNAYSVTSAGFAFSGNGDTGFQESLSPVLGVEMPFYNKERMTLSAVVNFQFFDFDTAVSSAGNAGAQEYTETFSLIAPFGGTVGVDSYVPSDIWPNSKVDSNYLSASGKSTFDMQLYVLDLGLKMAYAFNNGLEANLAFGPSLSLADMESSSYSMLRNGGTVLDSRKARDNDLEYIFGAYVALGASYWIDERYGLAFDLRYDEAFNHANTQLADLNLDSWSGMLKFLFRF